MSDIEFVDGLTFKVRNEKAPDYVLGNGSIKREQLIAWLQSRTEEWINWQAKLSKGGKPYVAVDPWKPNGERQDSAPRQQRQSAPASVPAGDTSFNDDDIPF